MGNKTELTYWQKLEALSFRFYSHQNWSPKKGDYYTSTRNDLELYQIVDEDDINFHTIYCDRNKQDNNPPAKWLKSEFLQGFGINRVHVPDYVFHSD